MFRIRFKQENKKLKNSWFDDIFTNHHQPTDFQQNKTLENTERMSIDTTDIDIDSLKY